MLISIIVIIDMNMTRMCCLKLVKFSLHSLSQTKYFMRETGNNESCEVVVKHCCAVPDLSFFHCPTSRLDVSNDTAILTSLYM